MLLKSVTILTLFSFLSTTGGFDHGFRAENRQFTYSALIVANHNTTINNLGEWNCSGALISDKFVTTAGVCIEGVTKFRIKLGATYIGNIAENKFEYVYDQIMFSVPVYHTTHIVALITLKPRCTFNPEMQPVNLPLPVSLTAHYINNSAIVTGWNGDYEKDVALEWLPMKVLSDADCWTRYPALAINAALCAEGDAIVGKDVSICNATGSPLVAENNTLIGISLFCQSERPQIFARIRWFTDWICETLRTL